MRDASWLFQSLQKSSRALTLALSFVSSLAFAANSGVTYQGRILKPDGSPLSGTNSQFKLQIRTPDSQNCLMYEEIQAQNLSQSNGLFSLTINDGTGSRTDSTGLTLDKIFANRGSFTLDPTTCTSGGGTYSPNASDGRNLVVLFKDETMASWEPIPAQRINFVPFSFEAKQVQGFTADSLLRVVNGSGDPITGLAPLSNAQYNALLALVNGTSTAYTPAGTLGGSALPTMTSGQVLGWNGTSWVSTNSVPGANSVTTAMLQAGAVTSSTIASGAVGTSQLASNVTINTSGTVGARDFRVYPAGTGTGYVEMQASPSIADGTHYLLTWPATVGSAGQVLTNDGTGALSWASPSVSSQWTTHGSNISYDGGGNVGIGTTAPTRVLDVEAPGLASPYFFGGWDTLMELASNGRTGIQFSSNGGATYAQLIEQTNGNLTYNPGSNNLNGTGYTLSIQSNGGIAVGSYANTANSTAPAPANGLAISGNVGIGTTAPATKLQVAGSVMLGDGGETCGSTYYGAIRYTTNTIQFCGTSGWTTLGTSNATGTVTSVTSANSDISVATTTTTPVLTLNSGTGASQIVKLDASAKLPAVDGSQLTNLNAGAISSGTLPVSRGGTGATSFTNYSAIVSNGSGNLTAVSTATSNQMLQSSVTGPSWSMATWPTSTTANQLLYSSASNVVGGLPTAASSILTTDASGVPSFSSTLPSAVQSNITSLGTVTSGTWNGSVVAPAYGGTGLSTYTTGDLLYASSSTALSKLPAATAGYVLTSNGAGAAPSWQAAASGSQWTTQAPGINYMGGSVGIGTTSPTSTLDVNGAISVRGVNGIKYPTSDTSVGATIAVGPGALGNLSSTSASYNDIAIGQNALGAVTTGGNNLAIGGNAMAAGPSTGSNNTVVGQNAGWYLYNGASNNTAVGQGAMYGSSSGAYRNSAFGANAIGNGTTGNYNTSIGANSGYTLTTGASNTLIGDTAGYGISTGANNIVVGAYSTNAAITTGSNNILIGQDVRAASATSSNQMNIGNLIYATGLSSGTTASTGNVGIGTAAPSSQLEVSGSSVVESRVTSTATNNEARFVATSNPSAGTNAANIMVGASSVSIRQAYINSYFDNSIMVSTQNTPRLRIGSGTEGGGLTIGSYATSNTVGPASGMIVSGSVGIGTTSPAYKLDVVGDVNVTGNFKVNGVNLATGGTPGGATKQIQFNDAGSFNGSSNLIWDKTNSFLGINAASPNVPLQVVPKAGATTAARFVGNSGYKDASISIEGYDSSGRPGTLYGIPGVGGFQTFLDANLRFWMGPGNNYNGPDDNSLVIYNPVAGAASVTFGKGSATANGTLDIKGSIAMSGSSSGFAGFRPAAAAGSTIWTLPTADGSSGQVLSTNGSGVLSWATASSSQWTTQAPGINYMGGNVGIGTTSPTNALDVVGSVNVSVGVTSGTNGFITGGPVSAGPGSVATPSFGFLYGAGGTGLYQPGGAGSTAIGFTTGGSEKMRINTTGNVGIGTTAPTSKLEVAGAILSTPQTISSGATVDVSLSNTTVLSSVGGSTITTNNLVNGGNYTIVVKDPTSRQYTFPSCTTSKFLPANTTTTASTWSMYTILALSNGSGGFDCMITWATGYQ